MRQTKQPKLFDGLFEEKKAGALKFERPVLVPLIGDGNFPIPVHYSFQRSPFGELLIASTDTGICFAGFADDREFVVNELRAYLPFANCVEAQEKLHQEVVKVFLEPEQKGFKLHIKGTPFQFRVWNSLVNIPFGQQRSYKEIAEELGDPNASRAVGSAVGDNPVAFWIPCHRVLHGTGKVGHFHWGTERKRALLNWEINGRG